MYQFAPIYVSWRIWHRFYEFFRHWYVRSFVIYGYGLIGFLEQLDRFFAIRITMRHFGEPLFQDRSAVGYLMGFFARSAWIAFGFVFYFFVVIAAVAIYIIWCLIPPLLLYKIFSA